MKIFNAKAEAKNVFLTSTEDPSLKELIPDCVIMGNGKGNSTGYLFCNEDKFIYVPTFYTDIKDLLLEVINALDKVVSSVTNTKAIMQVTGQAAGVIGNVTTTIQADLKPIIDRLKTINNNLK